MTEQTEQEVLWGILEVMGHKVYAGKISEHIFGGATLVRVDVPQTDDIPEFTKMFGGHAIYCLTPTTEVVARRAAAQCRERPVHLYDMPAVRRISQSHEFDEDEPDDADPLSYLAETAQ